MIGMETERLEGGRVGTATGVIGITPETGLGNPEPVIGGSPGPGLGGKAAPVGMIGIRVDLDVDVDVDGTVDVDVDGTCVGRNDS